MTKTLILGIGNILWADEGFGVRVVEYMAEHYQFDDDVTLLDGGTQGLYLLPFLEEAERLVVFDAVDYGLEPGMMQIAEGDEVPQFLTAKKMSLHQTGFQEVIATAQLMGYCPEEMILIGVQPVELEDFGGGLREKTAEQIPPAIQVALSWLEKREIFPKIGQGDAPLLADISVKRDAYEKGRPSEDDAFRYGDIRFLGER